VQPPHNPHNSLGLQHAFGSSSGLGSGHLEAALPEDLMGGGDDGGLRQQRPGGLQPGRNGGAKAGRAGRNGIPQQQQPQQQQQQYGGPPMRGGRGLPRGAAPGRCALCIELF